jgi:hypothetical protein
MLFTVSTVKDNVEGVERWVSRNIAAGVDHLIVFVDDADPDVLAWLEADEHTTGVGTDDLWWQGHRPDQLNARQRINANLARAALVALPTPQWLFHIDGDEVLLADRERLATLRADITVLWAQPWEAVSRMSWPEGRVDRFKRLLTDDELELLAFLGALPQARNEAYFHGHVKGKSGMRPGLDRWFTLHEVVDQAGSDIEPGGPAAATVLHYESYSFDEFVRKWTNLLSSGARPALRGNRRTTGSALQMVLAHARDEEARTRVLRRIYARTTEDDLELLDDLGLLVRVYPEAAGHRPESLPETEDRRLAAVIGALATVGDKRVFREGSTAAAASAALAAAARGLPGAHQDEVARRWQTAGESRLSGGIRRLTGRIGQG